VVYEGTTWPLYLCPKCDASGEKHENAAQSLEELRAQVKRTGIGRKKK